MAQKSHHNVFIRREPSKAYAVRDSFLFFLESLIVKLFKLLRDKVITEFKRGKFRHVLAVQAAHPTFLLIDGM